MGAHADIPREMLIQCLMNSCTNRNLSNVHEGSEVLFTVKESERADRKRAVRVEVLSKVGIDFATGVAFRFSIPVMVDW